MAARGILENPAMYSGHSITPKQESISHSSIKFYQSINQYLCLYKFSLHCSKLCLEIGNSAKKKVLQADICKTLFSLCLLSVWSWLVFTDVDLHWAFSVMQWVSHVCCFVYCQLQFIIVYSWCYWSQKL